jgi:4-amino-4-deoxy-L-arabinose transferase-like glycosyltransferase
MTAPPQPSLRAEWPYGAALLAFFVAAAVAIGAHRDVPVIDDWTYAWSVEQLLQHGRLAMLDWSAVFPIGPALWGTAWSLVFGLSFATLRISTLALAAVASGTLYLILRELEATPRVALLGATAMAANPAFLLLSSSFMTDVPFVAFTLLALLCYVRALRRGDPRLLLWAGAWACLSCLSRQVGVLTPVAALPLLIRPPDGRITRASVAWALAATGGVMAAGAVVIAVWLPPTGEMVKLVDRLAWVVSVPLGTYLAHNLIVLSTMAFYALPALLTMAVGRRIWRTRMFLVVVMCVAGILVAALGEIPVPLRSNNTWTLREVGGARELISGEWPLAEWPWTEFLLRSAGLLTLALAVLAVLSGAESAGEHRGPGDARGPALLARRALAALRHRVQSPRGPLLVYLAAYLVLANVLWFYNDRYLMVLLPLVVALALGHRDLTLVPPLAWATLAFVTVVAVAGTRDAIRFNQAVRDTWQALVDDGVSPSDIDAGYAWTGWVLYAHPENLAAGLTVDDVPWITSRRRPLYILSKGPLDAYDIVREVTWTDDAPWPGPDRLYVLRQRARAPRAEHPSVK